MKKITSLISLLMLAMLSACGGGGGSEEQSIDLSNVLTLGHADGLPKQVVKCTHTVDSVDMDFGCLLKSGKFALIPQNNSDYELTDISITVDNPQFEVTPAKIASIGAPDKSTGSIPIIQLSVNHRSPLNALTETDPLPVGENTATITITGFVHGQAFTVKTSVGVYAEALEVKRHADGLLYIDGPVFFEDSLLYSTFIYEPKTNTNEEGTYLNHAYIKNGTLIIHNGKLAAVWGPQMTFEGERASYMIDTTGLGTVSIY